MNAVIDADNSLLFTLCFFGLETLLRKLAMKNNFNPDQKSESGYSGLYLAALEGYRNIVRTDPNTIGGIYAYPLYAAAFAGYTKVA